MDILLSLPIASYFLAPSVTSWSTSLNLIFFYMTWATLVLSHSPLRIEVFGTLAVRLLLYVAPSLLFLTFDTLLPSLAESIKVGGTSALPPREDPALLARALALVLETLAMSGYSVVPGIIMGGITRRTAMHYCCSSGGRAGGNYGAWGLLDWVCGTNLGRDVLHDVKDEAEKHHVKERGESAAGKGMDFLQDGIEGVRRSKRTRKTRTVN
ncbi:hypothetical protein MAPG_02844 [Magnaporthiopsis poae ATCC 64411]|uniref:Uncharacterized protein n=1 Tax=Magnaporthiopsis poae (strain ATCC 64411 / 73-15) TaxID=644358 RepID=A0A0C4DSG5_MAGP6|nr:hypothetical protein MAPG_02844 [Magnaporthiopsis poae ATCC 64411]